MGVAVVTGASRGIGRAVVAALAPRWPIVAVGRDQVALEETAAGVAGEVEIVLCDVTDPDRVAALFSGRDVDVLVNGAGVASSAPLEKVDLADWDRAMAVNATAPFLCTREVLGGMRARDRGRIVFIASTASHVGARYTAAYTASKHAVLGLMRVVASEVAGSGVTANAVCPTYVDTPMTRETIARIAATTGRTEADSRRALEQTIPLGRLLHPEEVAAAVAFLASNEAAAINGQSIVIDGGGIQR